MEIKTIEDYYEQLYDTFPYVPKQDILKIVKYGWRNLYKYSNDRCDILVRSGKFVAIFGKLFKDSMMHYTYYINRLSHKLRLFYNRNKTEWDGYYYFGLTESDYQKYLAQKNKTGNPRKRFHFDNITLFKIEDECKISHPAIKYIFRVKLLDTIGFKMFFKTFDSKHVELIEAREIQKFTDILTCNYNYKLLNGNSTKHI